jgi:hypothetical protein
MNNPSHNDSRWRTPARVLALMTLGGWFLGHVLTAHANIPKPPNDEIPALKPPLGEIPPEVWEEHHTSLVTGGILMLSAISAAAWFVLRPRPVDPTPPEALARRELEALKGEAQTGKVLSTVSRVTRSYLSRAFNLPTAELTTTEFCLKLTQEERIGPVLGAAAQMFLKQCDERKFSPTPPPGPFNAVGESLRLVEQGQARLIELENATAKARKASQ